MQAKSFILSFVLALASASPQSVGSPSSCTNPGPNGLCTTPQGCRYDGVNFCCSGASQVACAGKSIVATPPIATRSASQTLTAAPTITSPPRSFELEIGCLAFAEEVSSYGSSSALADLSAVASIFDLAIPTGNINSICATITGNTGVQTTSPPVYSAVPSDCALYTEVASELGSSSADEIASFFVEILGATLATPLGRQCATTSRITRTITSVLPAITNGTSLRTTSTSSGSQTSSTAPISISRGIAAMATAAPMAVIGGLAALIML